MPTTDLKLDDCGTLPKPGPLGRLYRLGMGTLLFYFLALPAWHARGSLTGGDFSDNSGIWITIGLGLYFISYIINIGFSLHLKKWPMIVSAAALAALAFYDYSTTGDWTEAAFGTGFLVWTLYYSIHLGVCFILAAVIRTPGCEMRALHDLFSKITGIETKEHFCPVGVMQPLDNWEAKQSWMKNSA